METFHSIETPELWDQKKNEILKQFTSLSRDSPLEILHWRFSSGEEDLENPDETDTNV